MIMLMILAGALAGAIAYLIQLVQLPGHILDWYHHLLHQLHCHRLFGPLAKPLGLCGPCNAWWIGLTTAIYLIVVHHTPWYALIVTPTLSTITVIFLLTKLGLPDE